MSDSNPKGRRPKQSRKFHKARIRHFLFTTGLNRASRGWLYRRHRAQSVLSRELTIHVPAWPAAFDGIRIGHISDLHVGDLMTPSRAIEIVGQLAAMEADMICHTGDLVDLHWRGVEPVAKAIADINAPCGNFFVIGNHDVATLTKDEFLRECGATHPAYYSFDVGNVHFAVLDGNCHRDGNDFSAGNFAWDDAWVSAAQLEWLAQDLAESCDRKSIVFCHENLDHRLWNGELDPHILRNADQVRGVLETAGNVRAVIQAHYHPGLQTTMNGIDYLGLRAMVVGAGLENNSFAIVSVHADGRLVLRGFEQQPNVELQGGWINGS